MLIGAHAILYSKNTEADRAFLQKVLALPYVDVGEGWLIFSLPPAEIAVHPADSPHQELYLMCANVSAFVEAMTASGLKCSAVRDERWGLVTQLTLPSGSHLGVYEPRHARPKPDVAPEARLTRAHQRTRKMARKVSPTRRSRSSARRKR